MLQHRGLALRIVTVAHGGDPLGISIYGRHFRDTAADRACSRRSVPLMGWIERCRGSWMRSARQSLRSPNCRRGNDDATSQMRWARGGTCLDGGLAYPGAPM